MPDRPVAPSTEPAREYDSRAAIDAANRERHRLWPAMEAGHITIHEYVRLVMFEAALAARGETHDH